MVSSQFRLALGIIGDMVSSCLFLASLPTYMKIFRNRAVDDDFSPMSYFAILLNCITWIVYALLLHHSTTILVVNGIGAAFEVLYMIIALIFGAHRIRVFILSYSAGVLVSTGVASMLIFLGAHTPEMRIRYAGIICIISGVVMYASTIPTMVKAWKTKNRASVDIRLILVGLLGTSIWLLYGSLFHDLYMIIQNACGLLLCGIQILVYIVLLCRYPTPPAPAPDGDGA